MRYDEVKDLYKENSFSKNKIEHHTKYIETHGIDETVWIILSEHAKIDHRKLFPMVTKKELAIISTKANSRTEKSKFKYKPITQ